MTLRYSIGRFSALGVSLMMPKIFLNPSVHRSATKDEFQHEHTFLYQIRFELSQMPLQLPHSLFHFFPKPRQFRFSHFIHLFPELYILHFLPRQGRFISQ